MAGTTLRVCDIVYYGLDSFGKERQSWRITHHMKRVEDTLDDWQPDDIGEQIYKKILLENREKERKARLDKGLPANRRFRFKWCRQDEATHVSLAGICGAIAPIEKCEFIEEVEWPQDRIIERRKNAESDFWLNQFPTDYDWE